MPNADYPVPGELRKGDVLFPRRPDVHVPWALPLNEAAGTVPQSAPKDLSIAEWVDVLGGLFSLDAARCHALEAALTASPASQTAMEAWLDPDAHASPETGVWDCFRDLVYLCRAMVWSQSEVIASDRHDLPLFALDRVLVSLRTKFSDAVLMGQYIGHVALVDRDNDGRGWVLEGTYAAGCVRVLPYERWLAHRQALGAVIWHARMQKNGVDIDAADQQTVVDEAHRLRMMGTRYAIFDSPDLTDDGRIYCSEMIWRCGRQAGVELDTRGLPARLLPYLGPKALSQCGNLRMLNEPRGQRY